MLLINCTSRKMIRSCLIKMKIYPSTLSRVVQLPGLKQSPYLETSTLEIPLRSPPVAVGELNVQAKNKTQRLNCQTIALSDELNLVFV